MKKILLPVLFAFVIPVSFSCSTLKGYMLNEQDAASAVRQLLEFGARDGLNGAFTKDAILAGIFPESVRKTLNTLQQLGLGGEIDRFTTTLGTAAEKTATRSIPVFITAIGNIRFADAMRIVRDGGTSATDYLRSATGAQLRQSIKPVMQEALEEYKLNEQWNKLIKPAKALTGDKLNLDLSAVMASLVSEKMFQQLAERERLIRTDAAARTTPLLQKVFSRTWN